MAGSQTSSQMTAPVYQDLTDETTCVLGNTYHTVCRSYSRGRMEDLTGSQVARDVTVTDGTVRSFTGGEKRKMPSVRKKKKSPVSILNNSDHPAFLVPESALKPHYQASSSSTRFNHHDQTAMSTSHQSTVHLSSGLSTGTPLRVRAKLKHRYPCPHAELYRCSSTFSTSGHASRHAKSHTGKKDYQCPVCEKRFARKDNMNQHRRIHKHGNTGLQEDAQTNDSETTLSGSEAEGAAACD